MDKANQRIKSLQHDLANLKSTADQLKDEDDSDDDEDDSGEAIKAEIKSLEKENAVRQAKLDEYERNKKCTSVSFYLVCSCGRRRSQLLGCSFSFFFGSLPLCLDFFSRRQLIFSSYSGALFELLLQGTLTICATLWRKRQ